jgi:thiamine-monophosphate kinase
MIDTSDGFLGDLGHICKESAVGAELIQKKLPINVDLRQAAQNLGQDPYDLILKDSDDYELIITCAPDHVDQINSAVSALSDVPVTTVGRITDVSRHIKLILPDGTWSEITPTGWDHFADSGEENG